MPGSKDPNVIDGLSSIRAVQRASESGQARQFKPRPSQTRVPGPPREGQPPHERAAAPASRIGHTVIPVKHELLCYECGYAFVVQGVIHYPICPKCRRKLITENLAVEGRWTGHVKTTGAVEIKPESTVSGSIQARDILVQGNAEACVLHAGRRLELGPGAQCDLDQATFKEIRIMPEARISLRQALTCQDLCIEGELQAVIHAGGHVAIKPGGLLRGTLTAEHLTVEDGGGLKATLRVGTGAGGNTAMAEEQSANEREKHHGGKTRLGARLGRAH